MCNRTNPRKETAGGAPPPPPFPPHNKSQPAYMRGENDRMKQQNEVKQYTQTDNEENNDTLGGAFPWSWCFCTAGRATLSR